MFKTMIIAVRLKSAGVKRQSKGPTLRLRRTEVKKVEEEEGKRHEKKKKRFIMKCVTNKLSSCREFKGFQSSCSVSLASVCINKIINPVFATLLL